MATWGSPSLHHGPQGSMGKAGSLQVPDFVTSPPRFYSFEHFIRTPKPNHYFHLLDRASVWWGLFLSVAFKFSSFLGREGREERGNPSPLSCLPLWCSLTTAGSTHRPSGWWQPCSHTFLKPHVGDHLAFAWLCEPGRTACVRRPRLGRASVGPPEGLLLLPVSGRFFPSRDPGTSVTEEDF